MLGRTLILCLITLIIVIIIADLIEARRFRTFRPSRRRTTRRNTSPSNNRRGRTGTATLSTASRGQRTTSTRRTTTSNRRASSNVRRRTNPSTSRRQTTPQRSGTNIRRRGTTNTKTNAQRRGSSVRRTSATRRGTSQNRRVSNRRTATTSRRRGTSNQRRTQNSRRNTSRRRGTAIHSGAGRRINITPTSTTAATPKPTTVQPPTAETQVLPTSDRPPSPTSPVSSLVQLMRGATLEPPVTGTGGSVGNQTKNFGQSLKEPSVSQVGPVKVGQMETVSNHTGNSTSLAFDKTNSSAFALPLIKIPIPFIQTKTKSESRVVVTSQPGTATGNSATLAAYPQGAPQMTPTMGIASPIANAQNSQILPQPRNEIMKLQKLRIPFMMTALAPKNRVPTGAFPALSPKTSPSVSSVIPPSLGMEFDQGTIDAELAKVMTESDLRLGGPTQLGSGVPTMASRALPIQPRGTNSLSLAPNGSPSFSAAPYQAPSNRNTGVPQSFGMPQSTYPAASSPTSYSNTQAVYRAPYSIQGASTSPVQPTKPIQTPYQPYYSPTVQNQYTQYPTAANTQTNIGQTNVYGGRQQSGPIQYTAPTSGYGSQIGLNQGYGTPTQTSVRYVPYAGSSIQYAQPNTPYSASNVPYRATQPRYSSQPYRAPQNPAQPVYQAQYMYPKQPYNPTKTQSTQNVQANAEKAKASYPEQQSLYSPYDPVEPQVMNLVKEVESLISQTDAPLGPDYKDAMTLLSADPTKDLLATPSGSSGSGTIQSGSTVSSNTGKATIQGTALQTTTDNTTAQFTCPLAFGLFAHPQSCIRFMACSRNTPYDRPCPGGLVFNDVADGKGYCDYENNVSGCCGVDKSACPSSV